MTIFVGESVVLGLLKFWDAKNMLFACFHVIFARYSTTLVWDLSANRLSIYELPAFYACFLWMEACMSFLTSR